ncbi:hypothetical protein VTN02DRAFT_753 [Thermoascus thermophilus]
MCRRSIGFRPGKGGFSGFRTNHVQSVESDGQGDPGREAIVDTGRDDEVVGILDSAAEGGRRGDGSTSSHGGRGSGRKSKGIEGVFFGASQNRQDGRALRSFRHAWSSSEKAASEYFYIVEMPMPAVADIGPRWLCQRSGRRSRRSRRSQDGRRRENDGRCLERRLWQLDRGHRQTRQSIYLSICIYIYIYIY